MADKDFTGLSAATSLAVTDIIPIVNDPSGSKPHKKITVLNFIKSLIKQNQWEKNPTINNPDSGYMALYADTNGFFYSIDSSGVTRKLNPIRYFQLTIVDPATNLTVADSFAWMDIPADIAGMNLVYVLASCETVSSSGIPTFQIRNATDSVDMLSTKLTIDANEKTSLTAANAAVIDGTKDDVAEGDRLYVDVDVSGTGTRGVIVTLGFQYP